MMKDFLDLPAVDAYCLHNVAQGSTTTDGNVPSFNTESVYVNNGQIACPHDGPSIDVRGAMLLPAFVDMHTHIDKGHIWPRAFNADGTFFSALETVQRDRETNWCAEDIARRMNFALRCAYAHGTRALRTHLDSSPPQHRITWPVFNEVRRQWKNRIELQAVTIFAIDLVDDEEGFLDVVDAATCYQGILGCVTYPMPDLEARLEVFFRTASERNLDVDLHVDETLDPSSATLRQIAETAIKTKFEGKIVAGHCCSLASQNEEEAIHTIDLVAEAGIAIVSLPMCNLYLQDRKRLRTPRWRGVTLVHEMRQKGIQVSFASDNTRDPFYAYGDLDMLEVMREATRICHLDHSEPHWHKAFSSVPANICGFSEHKLAVGDPADFVIFNARNWSELFPRPQADRIVVRGGQQINRQLPDYRELDDLMEN